MNDIDRTIDYCTELDPLFPDTIRGAAPETIVAIERRLGRPIHPVHRRFLERMGAATGWLDFGLLDTTAEKLLDAHRVTRGTLPEGYELFGVGTDDPFEDGYLVGPFDAEPTLELFNTRYGADYGNVPGDDGEPLAGSLPEWICLQALRRFVTPEMPFQRTIVQTQAEVFEPILERFREVLPRHAFEPLWFSSALTTVASKERTIVVGRQFPDNPLVIEVSSAEPDAIVELVTDLFASLPVEPLRAR